MNYNFKHSRGTVQAEKGTTRGFDATAYVRISIERNDGHHFDMVCFWDWSLTGGRMELNVETTNQVEDWCRQHSLPSLRWIEDQMDKVDRAGCEDPMGCLSDYI